MKVVDADIEMVDEAKRIKAFDFLGHTIFVGLNASANESLVVDHKRDHKSCIWLHVAGRKGPSVVLCLGAKQLEAPVIVLRYAAGRALRMAGLDKGQVLYAQLQDVYKPEKAQTGIWRTWRTSVVEL